MSHHIELSTAPKELLKDAYIHLLETALDELCETLDSNGITLSEKTDEWWRQWRKNNRS